MEQEERYREIEEDKREEENEALLDGLLEQQ